MSRRTARIAAVEVLYAADVRGVQAVDLETEGDDVAPYTRHLIEAVSERREQIDGLLAAHSIAWRPDRMSPVDRNVLRVGVLELLEAEVPPAAVIDEAVEIAKRLSGEEAGKFVNGVLGGVLAGRDRHADRDPGQHPGQDDGSSGG